MALSSPKIFAATFLTAVETGLKDIDLPAEYASDPRAAKIGRAVERLGVHEVRILGAGSFGTAAVYRDDAAGASRVVKLTADETEVLAGSVLTSVSLPHVAQIYGSWFVRSVHVERWDSPRQERVGVLLQERLSPVTRGEAQPITDAWSEIRSLWRLHPNELAALPKREARQRLYDASSKLENRLRMIGLPMARDIADALRELRDIGVYSIDVHGGNIGRSGDQFKLFDVGSSSSPAHAEAPEVHGEAAEARKAQETAAQTPYVVMEGVSVDEIGEEEEDRRMRASDHGHIERSYDLPGGRTSHQVVVGQYIVMVTVQDGDVSYSEVYEGLLREPARPCVESRKAEYRARAVVRERSGVDLAVREPRQGRESPRARTETLSPLPFALVRHGHDVVPTLIVDNDRDEMVGVDVRGRTLSFGAEEIVGLVNAEPAAVYYGVRVDAESAAMPMAAEAGPGAGIKKGDVIIEYPGLRGRKGFPFRAKPRGQRFQWTPEKPLCLDAFPDVEPVLLRLREHAPSIETIRMSAIFAGLTVHAGTDEAEDTFTRIVTKYKAMHGAMPPVEEIQQIIGTHLPAARLRMYETVLPWANVVQDAMKRGLRDRELRRHIWVDLAAEDQVENIGLAKMSFAFMLMGQNMCCLDAHILGRMYSRDPENAEDRRATADRLTNLWKWSPATKGRELGLKRYEQIEDALVKNNPFYVPGPIAYARTQWVSWQWAISTPVAHRPWLQITQELEARRTELDLHQSAVPF